MPQIFIKPKQNKSSTKFSGFWLFKEEMNRLGLWPEMTETRANRSLEYASVPKSNYSQEYLDSLEEDGHSDVLCLKGSEDIEGE